MFNDDDVIREIPQFEAFLNLFFFIFIFENIQVMVSWGHGPSMRCVRRTAFFEFCSPLKWDKSGIFGWILFRSWALALPRGDCGPMHSTGARGHQSNMCAVRMRDDVFRIRFIFVALEPLKMVKNLIFLGGQWTYFGWPMDDIFG